ncbi:MAG: hypothetical protein WCL00_12190, partial [Bacteroidota bacterium]
MPLRFFIIILFLLLNGTVQAQRYDAPQEPTGFYTPDTVCVGLTFTIPDPFISGSTFQWNFCTANANYSPMGYNIGNPQDNLVDPRFITLVRDSLDCYSFVTDPAVPCITRNYHGHSFRNLPISSVRITNGLFTSDMSGIKIIEDNGMWYGYLANGTVLFKMTFTNGLMNPPDIIDLHFPNMEQPMGIVIEREGASWVGFTVDFKRNELIRLSFDANFVPSNSSLGDVGALSGPVDLACTKENNNWYLLVINSGNNTLTRISFGNSLMNTPTGENLGNAGGMELPTGIKLIRDCEFLNGYLINNQVDQNNLVHLVFPSGITGPIYGTPLPNVGSMSKSYGISELLRTGDTIYTFVTNEGGGSITRLYFPVCSSSSPPGYSGSINIPPITYSTPGNYNIILTVNEGTALQATICNNIVVMPVIQLNLPYNRQACIGDTVILDPGNFQTYLWSTGSTSRYLSTDTSGRYWVRVKSRFGCEASDTTNITFVHSITQTIDTSICHGQKFWAGGQYQTTTGSYYDSLKSKAGCDSVIYTTLFVKPAVHVFLGNDTIICGSSHFTLDATTPGATFYGWSEGTTDPTIT